jgi:hypothetical protein
MPDGSFPTTTAVSTPAATAATAQSHGGGAEPALRKQPRSKRPVWFGLGARLTAAASAERYDREPDDPVYRPLKIYTIDPSGRRLEGQVAEINIPFEHLRPGPRGTRFEVVANPAGPLGLYPKVDLDEPRLLIVNGHDPAPTDPVFHHQMVYAVAMSTFAIFRSALGREPSWGFGKQRLTLVPHADEEANARYVRDRGALEFGWYHVPPDKAGDLPPDGLVFACLSHDIIAHELTHAILDGLRVRFDVATNPDVGAFHEAFADLVALFQRFSYSEVVRSNIIRCAGDLTRDNELLHLVFELALGQGMSSLRQVDLTATHKYDSGLEEHDLGTVLVSAIIEAFLTIYQRRAAPLIRMATGGMSVIPPGGALSAELVDALSHLASRTASQVLTMCVRAIDYCPPVDITFGEYLRALITADHDLVPDDRYAYREALIDAFRRRRIYPPGVASLTEDALLWKPPPKIPRSAGLDFGALRFSGDPGHAADADELRRQARLIGELVTRPEHLSIFGLALPGDPDLHGDKIEPPVVESVRSVRRVGPDGQLVFDLVAEISQRRAVKGGGGYPAFDFYGAATVIFGASGEVRLAITKSIKSKNRLQAQRDYSATIGADVYALSRCRHEMVPASPTA